MSSLRARKQEFWNKFESSILEIIKLAVHNFLNADTLPIEEDDLNREFYKCLVSANYSLRKLDRGQDSPPIYEACNQPHHSDQERSEREYKRPDFQWAITDFHEEDPSKSSKQFVLECKRIGKPVGSWKLNKNYVNHGIIRFIKKEYGYAKGVTSSAMMGYMQTLDTEKNLEEVNSYVDDINQQKLIKRNEDGLISSFNHYLNIENSQAEFRLEHLWIDITNRYNQD